MKMKTMVYIGVLTAITLAIVGVALGVSIGGSSSEDVSAIGGPFKAVVVINVGNQKSGVTGVLELTQEGINSPVRVVGTVNNLKPAGTHGFHVHESGDLRGESPCATTGGHYNPHGKTHGAPSDSERHIGDLGNIVADASGTATIDVTDDKLSLNGPNSIIGRAFVVHEGTDDLGKGGDEGSLQTGNAGGRVACGLIGIIFPKKS